MKPVAVARIPFFIGVALCTFAMQMPLHAQGLFGVFKRKPVETPVQQVVPQQPQGSRPSPPRRAEPTPVPTPFAAIESLNVRTPGVWNATDGSAISLGGEFGGHAWTEGVPIGGIGTGAIEVLPDGRFANATILNSFESPAPMPGMVFALSTKSASGKGSAALLCLDSSRAALDSPALAALPAVRTVKALAAWPFMRLDFADPEQLSSLQVRLNAWSPFVPGSEKDSSYPAMVLELDIYNPNRHPVAVGAQLLLPDVIGRGGSGAPDDMFPCAPMVRHEATTTGTVSGIMMSSGAGLLTGRAATFTGTMFAGVDTSGVLVNRTLSRDLAEPSLACWTQFASAQRPQKPGAGVADGAIWSSPPTQFGEPQTQQPRFGAAVGCSMHIAPGERRLVPFIVSWHAPEIHPKTAGNPVVQTMTGARWQDARFVAADVMNNRHSLRARTSAWHRLFMQSNYPTALKSRVINDLSALASNSLLLGDGRYLQLPALGSGTGVAGSLAHRMETNGALAAFFPRLEAAELMEFANATDEAGNVPAMIGNFHEGMTLPPEAAPTRPTHRVDLPAQLVSALTNMARSRGDKQLAQLALEPATRALVQMQASGQNSVYSVDTPTSGLTAYGTGLRVAALRSGAWLQATNGKDSAVLNTKADALAQVYTAQLLRKDGIPRLDESTDSSFVAALAGDWILRGPLAGLKPLLTKSQAQTAAQGLLAAHISKLGALPVKAVADAQGTPADDVVHVPPAQASLLAEALLSNVPANTVAQAIERFVVAAWSEHDPWHRSLRFDGRTGKPISANASPAVMSSWRITEAIHGFSYSPTEQTIYLRPHILPSMQGALSVPVFTPLFYGMLEIDERTGRAVLTVLSVLSATENHGPHLVRRIVLETDDNGASARERTFDTPLEIKLGARLVLDRKPVVLELE